MVLITYTQPLSGRGIGGRATGHLAYVREVWALAKELGFNLKLNTVVTRINLWVKHIMQIDSKQAARQAACLCADP